MKFVVFSPVVYTGGPFALYQLSDAIKSMGHKCEVIFYNKAQFSISNGKCKVIYQEEFDTPEMVGITPDKCHAIEQSDFLIFPEVIPDILANFYKFGFKNLAFWWLSWDNAPLAKLEQFELASILPKVTHIFQSYYALENAKRYGFEGIIVSDYTSYDAELAKTTVEKDVDICYFARKAQGADALITSLEQSFSVQKIENMSISQVHQLLHRSKFFIDFGTHPGKDRIPREAAIYNCIPIVRRVGAATHMLDVPLPKILKPSSTQMSELHYVPNILIEFSFDHEKALRNIDAYRLVVEQEKQTFFAQVALFLKLITAPKVETFGRL